VTEPQTGILPEASPQAVFLTLLLAPGEAAEAVARRVIAGIPALGDEISAIDPNAQLACVIGVGSAAWDRLFPVARPEGLAPFRSFEDADRSAPASPADLLLHVGSKRQDLCFELVRRVFESFGEAVTLVEETHGFCYLDSRDLTGFVDGTENPQGEDRATVALLGESAGAFAGGSFVTTQRYVHDLKACNKLSIAQQEPIIGRTKADNIEFENEQKLPTAHIKRVSIKEDGVSLEMLRHSMPYGGASEYGLLFIAYTGRADTFSLMLEAMIVADSEGNYDHLTNFSRAVTGAIFFAPPRDWLVAQVG
jgi:putative iron-dependent peroxidase